MNDRETHIDRPIKIAGKFVFFADAITRSIKAGSSTRICEIMQAQLDVCCSIPTYSIRFLLAESVESERNGESFRSANLIRGIATSYIEIAERGLFEET